MTERIDSSSVGDPERFQAFEDLARELGTRPSAPREIGRVVLVVTRREGGRRETPERTRLAPETGVPGDSWGRGRDPKPDAQLTVMQRDVAESIANGQPLALFGDNLFIELDLSRENLPVGSLVRVGGATLTVSPKPHNGCLKFRSRFGPEALRFVSDPELRHRNLRGIYMRVVEAGEVAVGDPVHVTSR